MREHEHETPESILPASPRVKALDALLREVDGLRLTLETDLSLAASAVEAGHPGLAADILDSDRSSVAAFETRALGHLDDLAAEHDPVVVPLRRHRVGIATLSPFVAAAAVIALVLGLAPKAGTPSDDAATPVAAVQAIDALQEAAASGDTSTVRAASIQLHEQLLAVAAVAGDNPEMAQQALLMLSAEREAIVASGDMAALQDVLRKSTQLANQIRNALPRKVRVTVPAPPAVVAPAPSPSSSPSPKPKPTPSSSPAPKPTPTSSPSASPSASPSGNGVPIGNPMNGDDKNG